MNFLGNENDPLVKTIKELEEHSKASGIGNAGDFFSSTHERDPHVKKPTKGDGTELEFNAAIIKVDESTEMCKYVTLQNLVLEGVCICIDESIQIDKKDGNTSIFFKWLQPKGSYEIGTINQIFSPAEVKAKLQSSIASANIDSENDVVDDTNPNRKAKGKGSRKKNMKNPKVLM